MISTVLHYQTTIGCQADNSHLIEDLIATERGERRPPGGRNVMLEAGGGDW